LIFPETYVLLIAFTIFTIWGIVTEGWTKKILSIIFSLMAFGLINTATVSYVILQPQTVDNTTFTYQGNKVTKATNDYNNLFIQRQTTTQNSSIQSILSIFYVILVFLSISLFVIESFDIDMPIGKRVKRD